MTKDEAMKEEEEDTKKEEEEAKPEEPALETAAWRLERLLTETTHYSHPAKVVRRWLGTASGAAGSATTEDIQVAAGRLLQDGPGKDLLGAIEPMETKYLSQATREVETWLVTLQMRILWKEGKNEQAFQLAQQALPILAQHLDQAALQAPSLFPLYARLLRWRALVASTQSLREEHALAHNMATLRRDVDSQATLLNAMLRDMLQHSQSTWSGGSCTTL